MNIITSQIHQSKSEVQEIVCQIHKQEIVAIDLDIQEKGNYQYLCCNCLVEKMNNNKISTIEQTKDRIKALQKQRQENKIKEIQIRLDNFKIIQEQIMEFKCNVENTLEKIYSQIKAQIFTIQKEKQSLLDNFQIQHNFQEEVKSLSEFLSTETQEKQLESIYDSQFIDEIVKQFDLIFNSASYFQTIDTFKDCKQKINEINQNNQIELMSLQNKNSQKTPSLNKICSAHNKEIIMIDIDSKLKNIEERFACVDCISDHPNCQYRTIEKINQQWNNAKKQQDRIFSDLKIKRQEKQEKLNQQISIMRKNYNQQLNEISEKLITEFSMPKSKSIEINKIKQTSLQQLSNEELLQNINEIILNEKENLVQDSKVEYLKSKDTLFLKEIESKLENLKQHDQLDIQESINILKDVQNDSQIQRIFQLSQQIQETTQVNQEQLILKQDLDELINSSKYIYCQKSLLNESIQKFQEHLTKIQTLGRKLQQIPDNLLMANLNTQTNDYKNTFEKDFQQFMKFCEIENLEKNFETLQQDHKRLELERNQYQESIEKDYKLEIQRQNDIIEELKQLVNDTEFKLKQKVEQEQLLNEKLKVENANNTKLQLQLNDQQDKHENEIKSLNEKINQSEIQINKIQNNLDIRIQASIFLDIYQIEIQLKIILIKSFLQEIQIKKLFKTVFHRKHIQTKNLANICQIKKGGNNELQLKIFFPFIDHKYSQKIRELKCQSIIKDFLLFNYYLSLLALGKTKNFLFKQNQYEFYRLCIFLIDK
ncbi:unnamed protein product [Paramecium octaurelia]|uniref:Uncharacterized protein n=1 Tax=Paramecium octaurelia TaxID=43137 RepID=A0A8S1W9S3_PAROT|nr:unnamed protein product [Paramecium octaurelia]